ncbi:MAG: hydantoinase/oxoprolinase family protein [Alphaproteobacteria bacterium]|nr:hydantoinase/oxoprolinase family protein [Alphaproteobacteria bacterium]
MTTNGNAPRLGVDIGGTFTDVALETPKGWFTTKVLTTPRAPEQAVMQAIRIVLNDADVEPGSLGLVIHGTTLATNALIERKGARTALLTTDGFRDTLQIATEGRFDVYDVNLDLPVPLVPRHLRLEVKERMTAQGVPLIGLDEAELGGLIDKHLVPNRIESVAIGFLHAYVNPAHERRARDILLARLPGLSVSLSSEVSPEMREYERFSTTCANAYVQPLMGSYLRRLESELQRMGMKCPLFLMQSGGGLTTIDTATRYPVRLVESGPAGGAIFAGHLAKQMGLDHVLSFDMGGTTAKICVIDDHAAQTARGFEVARVYRFKKGSGMPIRIPVIEMVEIGAGGGSIAAIDALGRVGVGPESAGSEPGPACYGRGGREPTVTDADLVLGRIDPQRFSGGRVTLDPPAASEALSRVVGGPMQLDGPLAAFAVSEMVDTNMANAARIHAIESGKELESRTLIAFGGAAPLHAARVADKLGIGRIVVPSAAGVGSCVGFLRAPIAFEVVRSHYLRLNAFDHRAANRVLEEMRREASDAVRRAAPDAKLQQRLVAYMRYVGQGTEIVASLDGRPFGLDGTEVLRAAFEDAYRRQYNRIVPGSAIEIISFGLTVWAEASFADAPAGDAPGHAAAAAGTVKLFDPEQAASIEVNLYRREDLKPGARLSGPALITEAQTSTVVAAGMQAEINRFGHIELTRTAR